MMFKSITYTPCLMCRMCSRRALHPRHLDPKKNVTLASFIATQRRLLGTDKQEKSALYVNPTETDRSPTVEVSFDIQERLKDIDKLKNDILLRGLNFDADALRDEYENLNRLKREKDLLEKQHREISRGFAELVRAKKNDDIAKEAKKELSEKGRELRPRLKAAITSYYEAENTFNLMALKLPVELAPETQPDTSTLAELGVKAAESQKSHLELLGGSGIHLRYVFPASSPHINTPCPSDISPGAYYLTGNVSNSERQLVQWTKKFMNDLSIPRISCPELFREAIVEGCGFTDEEILRLEQKLDSESTYSSLSLCSSGLLGFAAYFTRMHIHEADLPLQCYSSSVVYSSVDVACVENYGLYCVPQRNSVDMFSLNKSKDESSLSMAELAFNITQFYEEIKIPIRINHVGSSSLRTSESQRIDFEVWSSAFNRYFKIGEVSDRSDFISRRLMITNSSNARGFKEASPPFLIHATLTSIQPLLAAILENSQSKDGRICLSGVY